MYWEVWMYLFMFVCVCVLVYLCACVYMCVLLHACACVVIKSYQDTHSLVLVGRLLVLTWLQFFSIMISMLYLRSPLALHVRIRHCTHLGCTIAITTTLQPLGLEVMLGHAPVAGLLESGGRSTCVQQSSRGVCPLCWTSVHCSLATTIWLPYTL